MHEVIFNIYYVKMKIPREDVINGHGLVVIKPLGKFH